MQTAIRETREPVDERLLLDGPVPLGVGKRDHRVTDKPARALALLGREVLAEQHE